VFLLVAYSFSDHIALDNFLPSFFRCPALLLFTHGRTLGVCRDEACRLSNFFFFKNFDFSGPHTSDGTYDDPSSHKRPTSKTPFVFLGAFFCHFLFFFPRSRRWVSGCLKITRDKVFTPETTRDTGPFPPSRKPRRHAHLFFFLRLEVLWVVILPQFFFTSRSPFPPCLTKRV